MTAAWQRQAKTFLKQKIHRELETYKVVAYVDNTLAEINGVEGPRKRWVLAQQLKEDADVQGNVECQ